MLGGTALAAIGLIGFAGEVREDFADLALGPETASFYARVDGTPIHCKGIADAVECIDGDMRRGARPTALWLGNSQLHGINQLKPGDETAVAILQRRESARGRDLLGFSEPNASVQEHLVLFVYLAERLPIDRLILPVVFDDFREDGIRSDLLDAFTDPAVMAALEQYAIGRTLVANHGGRMGGNLAALEGTVQYRVEAFLNGWLERHWRLWELRPQARGSLFSSIYRVRNTVFGISAQTKRRVIPGRLAANLAATRAILDEARKRGIAVLLYVAPLRSDVEAPYVADEYAAFKREVAAMAREAGADFADLDDIVPSEDWGTKDTSRLDGGAELDFMHFQATGHARLADAVGNLLQRDDRR